MVSRRRQHARLDFVLSEHRLQQVDYEVEGRVLIVEEEDLDVVGRLRHIQHESSQWKVINRRMNLPAFGSHFIKTP
jgi:hypothetical protein